MIASKWHMHRMGLIDFWYYVNEEFLFEDGHMLLRGSNGSGKSVTMQSFIPLLLDGNKSSERLDSFGTRSRKLENYLLEEEGDREDRIGYLYLEFKREDSDLYKTIGMGLHARRNKPLDSWYFVIEDNRRIERDIFLMEDDLAITKQMLKNKIGSQLIDTQKEYMEKVNKALFNFATLDEYRECINLLMQLRSPKLSNSLKPTMINEILSNSLQPLSEEDLRPMSEAISNMDEIQDQLDALKLSYSAAKQIANVYEQYNYASLEKKTGNYLKKEQVAKQTQRDIKNQETKNQEDQLELTQAKKSVEEKKIEEELLKDELSNLLHKDVLQLVEEVERFKKEKISDTDTLAKKQQQEKEKDSQYIEAVKQLNNYQNEAEVKKREIHRIFNELSTNNQYLQFEEHGAIEIEMMSNLDVDYDFTYTKTKIDEELKALDKGLILLNDLNSEKRILNSLNDSKEKRIAEIENKNKERAKFEQQFYDLLEQYQEQFSIWNKNNHMLRFEKNEMQFIFDQLRLFIDNETYESIAQYIQERYRDINKKLETEENKKEYLYQQKRQEILEKRKELDSWEKQKEPAPIQDSYVESSRQFLKQTGIPTRPLYELLDFKEEIPKDKRNIFEEQLSRMGLLNSLIVSKEYQNEILSMPEGVADQFVFIDKNITDLEVFNLSLREDGNLDLQELLLYLGVDTKELSVWDYKYQSGIVTGIVSRQTPSQFIGKQAREEYRLSQITRLQKEITSLEEEAKVIHDEIDTIQISKEALEEETKSYPKKEPLLQSKEKILDFDKHLRILNDYLHELDEQIGKIVEKATSLSVKINEIASRLGIGSTFEVFSQRKEKIEEYSSLLRELNSVHREYLACNEMLISANNRKMELLDDLDTIRYEMNTIESHLATISKLITQKEEKLKEVGYENVRKRIDEIYLRQNMLPTEIDQLNRLIGRLETTIKEGEKELCVKKEELSQQIADKEKAYEIYLEEAQLNYILTDSSIYKDASYVCQYIKERKSSSKTMEVLGNDLQTVFYNQRGALQEYGLSIHSLFEENEGNSRLDINARYKGEGISFTQLLVNLENDIERQKLLLEENDRILIEDILINTISRKIRSCIQSSRRWVDTMNRYMNSMDTSSGLKLNLQWKSHKAETAEELNSEQLVALLDKDPKILKESDFKSLSSHFQSKIQAARKLSDQMDNHESFHQIMKKVMDYRTWFEFKIQYEKTGEKKRELTNSAFFAFSGGEKAMSMYVPLFSAVAAKFEGAAKDAPILIALDEAFAGVDEKNINNMFTLISKFGFDYIMNSQVLWGDYPSVKALAIHELFRPENAHYVTIISYVWNGNEKVMVS